MEKIQFNKEQVMYMGNRMQSNEILEFFVRGEGIVMNSLFIKEEEIVEAIPATEILLCGKRLFIDLDNLKDSELAMRDADGDFESNGEHYFTQENGMRAAEKVGKRLLTPAEFTALAECKNVWDAKRKGRWFQCPTPDGSTVDIFFPSSGVRHREFGAFVYIGTCGPVWSSAVSDTNGYYLDFNSTNVYPQNSTNRAYGFPVRCVIDLF